MGETDTALPDWAWAVLDQVITTTDTGFTETHTLAIAASRDPARSDYLTPPQQLPHFQGMPVTGSLLREWGWDELGPLTGVDTQVLEPVTTTLFGEIPPYRGAFRVRRTTIGTPAGTIDPVPYGPNLAAAFSTSPGDHADHAEAEGPPWDIAAALLALEETGLDGRGECEDAHRRHMAGDDLTADDLARSHAFLARRTLEDFTQWFTEQIRAHGLPRAGIDPAQVCFLAAAHAAASPDPTFRRECLTRAKQLAATGDIDPEYLALLESSAHSW
ncbi:hypothetical protein [Glycomyces harbinensis]|uniref:Uncharacterized protein n=1 Tax=Glycomyces harbinensis TaxID=58114 RepID=A0A1G6WTR1_9ACTN|nr:hypothetical protein [Glycomyces harbinensis]SDD69278.1 hypothetical protein SAMN05216270_106206 [Glycomyces harbinensis]